jgi:predicted transcriptional regulator
MAEEDKDLQITQKEIATLDQVAKSIIAYSEDDRRKADDLYSYYQELITKGDTRGDTRMALAKSLELREMSVNNLIEILKLKARIIEKKLSFEIKREMIDRVDSALHGKRTGMDTNDMIKSLEMGDEDEK